LGTHFTLVTASRKFVILVHWNLVNFVSNIPYNDIIFSQSVQGIQFISCQQIYHWLKTLNESPKIILYLFDSLSIKTLGYWRWLVGLSSSFIKKKKKNFNYFIFSLSQYTVYRFFQTTVCIWFYFSIPVSIC
jgi:hypothetical protein